jgi:hypothetical protein
MRLKPMVLACALSLAACGAAAQDTYREDFDAQHSPQITWTPIEGSWGVAPRPLGCVGCFTDLYKYVHGNGLMCSTPPGPPTLGQSCTLRIKFSQPAMRYHLNLTPVMLSPTAPCAYGARPCWGDSRVEYETGHQQGGGPA